MFLLATHFIYRLHMPISRYSDLGPERVYLSPLSALSAAVPAPI